MENRQLPGEIAVTSIRSRESIDDETVAYILLARRHFEDLRQVAAQLAGLLVLAATGGKSATPDHPMLDSAERLHASTSDAIRNSRATVRGRTHHDCLSRATSALDCALTCARTNLSRASRSPEIDLILKPLQEAYFQLQLASAALPGFELISFEHACCAPRANTCVGLAGGE